MLVTVKEATRKVKFSELKAGTVFRYCKGIAMKLADSEDRIEGRVNAVAVASQSAWKAGMRLSFGGYEECEVASDAKLEVSF